jgi:integrase
MGNDTNDILRYRFQHYQQHAKGKSDKTMDEVLYALTEYEDFTGGKDFHRLNSDDIVAFKEHLAVRQSKTSHNRLSATTLTHRCAHLKTFFTWLLDEPEGRKIRGSVVDYFTPDLRTRAAARTTRPRRWAPVEVWITVLEGMPCESRIERRDRAIVALLILTVARAAALVSLRIKHLDLGAQQLIQDGTEVDTKFGKSMYTSFFPINASAREILVRWYDEMIGLGALAEDPLFPSDVSDAAFGLYQQPRCLYPWGGTGPIRRIVKEAFELTGHRYVVPHSVRHSMEHEGINRNLSLERHIAWSTNIGHNSLGTTIRSYGRPAPDEVAAVMRKMAEEDKDGTRERLIRAIDELTPEKQGLVLSVVQSLAR